LADLCGQAKKEKLGKDGMNDAEILESILTAKSDFKSWNLETCRRYLLIGRRLNQAKITSLLDVWEFYHRRNTLVDSISVLRGLCGVFVLNLWPWLYIHSTSHHETLRALVVFIRTISRTMRFINIGRPAQAATTRTCTSA